GFLGAGVIMRDGMNVRGLNTAATLWCSAGIGVLCGLGQFWNATAVMDYLTLCESYAVWLLDEVPPLATEGPAAQQRFINVIDV
ncbi:MgtC/SapB family protein, partial [Klebsiella pneumoniae]|uniref:AFG1/ZapE family ATPase n=1 Tax=Klebsiella pneumoniae TaxID=573 RepID=UPI0023812775